jgi:hypothetical protein
MNGQRGSRALYKHLWEEEIGLQTLHLLALFGSLSRPRQIGSITLPNGKDMLPVTKYKPAKWPEEPVRD